MTVVLTALLTLGSTDVDFFEKRIRPVLVKRCYRCHSPDAKKVRGGLLLDTREGIRRGGESGAAVVPGEPKESILLEALRHEGPEMPPEGKLPDSVIADFEKWIRGGAVDPRDGSDSSASALRIKPSVEREFWSFRPPEKRALPPVTYREWPSGRLDVFVLARLEEGGTPTESARRPADSHPAPVLRPHRPPARTRGGRRLPPGRLPPRLRAGRGAAPVVPPLRRALVAPLARRRPLRRGPGSHRRGATALSSIPTRYIYRDWVIDALNDDVTYDRFIELQLAADFVEPPESRHVAALGFLGLGPKYYSRGNPAVMADEWEDRVDTVTRGLLGLTVACARCHDHKYDPVSTEDYYALAGVFASTDMFNRPLDEKRERGKDGTGEETGGLHAHPPGREAAGGTSTSSSAAT